MPSSDPKTYQCVCLSHFLLSDRTLWPRQLREGIEGRVYLGFLFQRERVHHHHNGDDVISIVGTGAPMGSSYLKTTSR